MDIAIVLGTVVLAMVLFATDRVPLEVSSLTLVCVLAVTGVLTPEEAFAGFANETVIFIFTLLAMTQGLSSTGLVQMVGQRTAALTRFGQRSFLAAITGVVASISSFVSNTVTTAALYPVACGAATRAKIPKSKVLMPVAFASMLGGTILLFGTSTNLIVSATMKEMGMPPLGVFELAPIGIPMTLVGLAVLVLLAPRLLPARHGGSDASSYSMREYLTEVVVTPDSRYLGKPLSEITDGVGLRVLGLFREGTVLPPNPGHVVALEDRLIVAEDREDIMRVKDLKGIELKPDLKLGADAPGEEMALAEVAVPVGSPLVGKSLKESLFSERYGLVALAIHRRPAIQRWTKLQLLKRSRGAESLSTVRLAMGDVLLVHGPKHRLAELAGGTTLTVLSDHEYQPPRHAKAAIALVLFLGSLGVGSTGLLPLSVAGLAGLLLMIAFGCLNVREAFRVDFRVVLLIGSVLALGVAMEKSGAGLLLGQQATGLAEYIGARGVLCLLMIATIVLSAPMSNQAAALVLLPVAIASAHQLGVDPRAFAVGICLAASCSFITPLEPSCVLVYGPGRYRFSDFFRLGAPLTAVLLVMLTLGVPMVWPFHPKDPDPRGGPRPTALAPAQGGPAVGSP